MSTSSSVAPALRARKTSRGVIADLAVCGTLVACGVTLGQQALARGAVGAGAAAIVSGGLLRGAAIGATGNRVYCPQRRGRCPAF